MTVEDVDDGLSMTVSSSGKVVPDNGAGGIWAYFTSGEDIGRYFTNSINVNLYIYARVFHLD